MIVGYVSHHLQGGGLVSGSVRYQRRSGPNLLAQRIRLRQPSFTDSRFRNAPDFRAASRIVWLVLPRRLD